MHLKVDKMLLALERMKAYEELIDFARQNGLKVVIDDLKLKSFVEYYDIRESLKSLQEKDETKEGQ